MKDELERTFRGSCPPHCGIMAFACRIRKITKTSNRKHSVLAEI
jgi:hypothetical protein